MKHYRAVINIEASDRLSSSDVVFRIMGRFGNLRDMDVGMERCEPRPLLDVNIQPEQTTLEETNCEKKQS